MGTKEDWTLVHNLSTTEYLNYEKTKFSKSNSVGVFGDHDETTEIPSEVWRYYLLSNRQETSDTDFKWDDFVAKNNNELLANFGNLVNRIFVFTEKNFSGKIPKYDSNKIDDIDKEFFKNLISKFNNYIIAMKKAEIREN